MKKIFSFIAVFMIVAVFMLPGPVDAKMQRFQATVYAWRNGDLVKLEDMTRRIANITYEVLAVGTDTKETLYSDRAVTAKTNPVTSTVFAVDDRIDFWCDPTDATNDTYVDLIVTDYVGGYSLVVDNFHPGMRTLIIDERPNVIHHGIIRFSGGSGSGLPSETTTSVDFEYDTWITDVRMETVTVTANAATYDVGLDSTGTNGDVDGFIDGVSVATAGYTVLSATTYGALIDDGTTKLTHVVESANEQTLTFRQVTGSDTTAAGYIHYFFVRVR